MCARPLIFLVESLAISFRLLGIFSLRQPIFYNWMYVIRILSCISVFFPAGALADIDDPDRTLEKIHTKLETTEFVKVRTARVAYVNYDLLATDFDDLKQKYMESEESWKRRLDIWVEDHASFIRASQLAPQPIPVNTILL